MPAIETLGAVIIAALIGLASTALLERLLRPVPDFFRPWPSWSLHAGIWCWAYGLCAVLSGQPWLALGGASALFGILILVNNAKVRSLQEPFIFQDYEYFIDALAYPRLYLPFFGWKNFIIATASIIFLLLTWLTGPLPIQAHSRLHVLYGALLVFGAGALCLHFGYKKPAVVRFHPLLDVQQLGFLPCLWHYGLAGRALPTAESPFSSLRPPKKGSALPHLVAVQSESFFDPRRLFSPVRADLLAEYDRLKTNALAWGALQVPAWGANTVRTEFAFLSSIDDSYLGAHRFNPYRAVVKGWRLFSLPLFLRSLGYRTICIHPYYKSFYLRDQVFPLLGFDEFWDIKAFSSARRFGPYISDMSVAEKIMQALRATKEPLFVFAITMENHGPLHLEKIDPSDAAGLYDEPLRPPCAELTVYLRHIRNANAMIGSLREGMEALRHPASLCWYGDHVPIMPQAYALYGTPPGAVEYVLWTNHKQAGQERHNLAAHCLALKWCNECLQL